MSYTLIFVWKHSLKCTTFLYQIRYVKRKCSAVKVWARNDLQCTKRLQMVKYVFVTCLQGPPWTVLTFFLHIAHIDTDANILL